MEKELKALNKELKKAQEEGRKVKISVQTVIDYVTIRGGLPIKQPYQQIQIK